MRCFAIVAATLCAVPSWVGAQQAPVHWQRRDSATQEPITVFHSPQSANLPTAETLRKGEWQFEISHRFTPRFSDGKHALWGLDGPAMIRLGLVYAATSRVNVGVLRTNFNDNLEVNTKIRIAEGGRGRVPWMAAVMGGAAFNTELAPAPGIDGSEPQAYGQLILNAFLHGKWAVGLVPSLLYNPYIDQTRRGTVTGLGLNSQLYVARGVSLMAEWNVSRSHEELEHDAGSFGIELETGGHFFKFEATNSTRPNPTQFLAGTPYPFTPHEWRFGFNITRLLAK